MKTALVCFCCTGWRRLACVLDNISHLLPRRLQLDVLCDWHDRLLVGEVERDA